MAQVRGTQLGVGRQRQATRIAPTRRNDQAESVALNIYRNLFGWPVERDSGELRLSLGNGLIGVIMPSARARHVATLLQRQGHEGPVLEVAGDPPAWVFLAERNGLVLARRELPHDVEIWDCPRQVPLPISGSSSAAARWIAPPNRNRRLLPILATVAAAARAAL